MLAGVDAACAVSSNAFHFCHSREARGAIIESGEHVKPRIRARSSAPEDTRRLPWREAEDPSCPHGETIRTYRGGIRPSGSGIRER